jgi:hypothetical protein
MHAATGARTRGEAVDDRWMVVAGRVSVVDMERQSRYDDTLGL